MPTDKLNPRGRTRTGLTENGFAVAILIDAYPHSNESFVLIAFIVLISCGCDADCVVEMIHSVHECALGACRQ